MKKEKIEDWQERLEKWWEDESHNIFWLEEFIRQLLIQEKTKDRQKFIDILEELNEFVETESGKSGRKEILQKIQKVINQLNNEK